MKALYLLPILLPLSGCPIPPAAGMLPSGLSSGGGAGGNQVTSFTHVQLNKANFRVVKANAMGESRGFKLLGLLTFKSPEYTEAITQLYQQAGVLGGRPEAMVNMVYEQTSTYFILFSLPKISVRGDLVEFVGRGGRGAEWARPESAAQPDSGGASSAGRP